MQTTAESKVLRDPVHGYIHIDAQVIWDLLDTPEFQRLRRIRQLGGVFQVYHAAEHSRFAHSLGVYEIVRRMVIEVEDIRTQLSDSEKEEVLCAALLHDLGHGPFSHSFENVSDRSHEQMTADLILQDTKVHEVLRNRREDLPEKVASIIQGTHEKSLVCEMVSGQLDADRMDYLLRDAYETGTSYGTFDLERVLRCLRVRDGHLCIKESGMHSVEDYIMARYHMYWQVYLHPDARSFEIMLERFFVRYGQIREMHPIPLLENVFHLEDLSAFQELDDYRMITGFQEARKSEDPVLSDLADRLLNRRLFGWIENPEPREEENIRRELASRGLPEAFYLVHDISGSRMYLPYRENQAPIRVLDSHGHVRLLSEKSAIVKALDTMEPSSSHRLCFPKKD